MTPARATMTRTPAVRAGSVIAVLALVAIGLTASRAPDRRPSPLPVGLRAPLNCGLTVPPQATLMAVVPEYQALSTAGTVEYEGASLAIGATATTAPVPIGITPLTEAEMAPMDTGMTNVTGAENAGFRFTPHPFQFEEAIEVEIPYDAVRAGERAGDIHTYWFEESSGCWKPLERVRVDAEKHVVVSRTDHFTDMANAVVTAPESPETQSFNPTQIKDLETADPGEGLNLISAPVASNSGEANLTYPLELPPGRAGVQPQLAIGYSSGAENGWLGVGWDLPAASVAVDTRWGVPRYDGRLETETYVIGGQQLTPVAHRGPLVARAAERVFHPRVEGGFSKIIRHGSAPKGYSWEVIDRSGTRSFYGGPGATLADDAGNVFRWALREIRDTHGNVVRFHHVLQEANGRELYLQKITYTGDADTEGPYAVTFIRDRELEEPPRADVSIDARGGFKHTTADLLRRVEVTLDNLPVRAYELGYTTGAFGKTLLRSITQFDENNAPFTTHTFDYYDDIRDSAGGYQAFAPVGWQSPDDNLGTAAVGEASALGGTTSTGAGGHLYLGTGAFRSKTGSIGVKAGFSGTEQEGLVALTDVDGDNLPDKVFRRGNGMVYRKNLAKPGGEARFADDVTPLAGLPGISRENTETLTAGLESYLGAAVQLDHVDTFTTTDRYFADVNADGLTDLVNGDDVLFGRIGTDGAPVYGTSAGTPVPIGSAPVDASGLVPDHTVDRERQTDSYPLIDTVRRWVAPYDGTVSIDGDVRLVDDPAAAAYADEDGVRVAIQHENAELWGRRIEAADHAAHAPAGVGAITVRRGDRLYFRVQSVADGAFDRVAWDPRIAYTGVPATTDVNDLDEYTYQASRDFTLGGRATELLVPATGTVRLSGALSKAAATTDDVTVRITVDGNPVVEQTLAAARTGEIPVDRDVAVSKGQRLRWEVRVDSPIDLGALTWTPAADFGDGRKANPAYDIDMYPVNDLTAPQQSYVAPQDGTLLVRPTLPAEGVVFTVKSRGALLAKGTDLEVPVTAGQELFFDYSTRGASTDNPHPVLAGYTPETLVEVPSALHAAATDGAFPEPYRGWGVTGWNGNRAKANGPIIQSELVIDASYADQLPADVDPQRDAERFAADPRIAPPKVFPFAADPAAVRWEAGEHSWAGRSETSSSRLGTTRLTAPAAADFDAVTGVPRVSRSTQISLTGGVGGDVITVGGSVATGDSVSELDYLDMNGDGFPDVVGAGGIRYTDPNGLVGATAGATPEGVVRRSGTRSGNASAGSAARTITTGKGYAAPPAHTAANTASSGNDMPPLGLGGSLGTGSSTEKVDLLDINGDNLPDRVHADGRVALNLGYRFAAAEAWPGAALGSGTSTNSGVNIGFNTDFYGFAGGASRSESRSATKGSLADVNGDGLADRVIAGNPIRVAINTGGGFADPVPFNGSLNGVNADVNATLGAGAYLVHASCIGILLGCVIVNPGADTSTGVSRTEQMLRDIDGDGNADHLRSTSDGSLQVAQNQTGRTNLLKQVTRPLGAKISLDYTRDGNTYDLPGSKYVLSRVVLHDGQAGDGQDTQVNTFRYAGGRYDRLEREFRGYGRIVDEQRAGDAVFRTTTREFRTDSHYTRGLPTRTVTADAAGNPFEEKAQTYRLQDADVPARTADPASLTASLFPQLVREDTKIHEGQATAGQATYTETAYDDYGNVIRTFESGEPGTADDLESTVRFTAEDAACRGTNIVGTPKAVDVRGNGTLLRHREATVACATGDVTQHRAMLADGTKAVTDVAYFADGNVKQVTGPANANGQRFRLDYEYDPATTTYRTAVTDSFGLRSTSTYHLKYGTVETTTDVNGQRLRYYYDSVGRVDQVIGARETAENHPTIDYEYHPEATVPYAVTRHVDRNADGTIKTDSIDTITFTDGLSRVLQVKKDATVGGTAMMTVSGRAKYDFAGRAVERYYPTTEAKGPLNTRFKSAFDTVRPARTEYDVLDRAVRVTLPDETVTTSAYGFGPDRYGTSRLQTTAVDARGGITRTFADVRGQTTAVSEDDPATWTSYAYDAIGQLTEVTDDKGNRTTAKYDNLGRRTLVDSPDNGRIQTTFDLTGNAVKKDTAQFAAISYTYDFDRLIKVTYPSYEENDVTYTYGAAGVAGNGAGRVVKVDDAAGTIKREYGPQGETVKETRTVASYGREGSYTTQYRYDAFNRMLGMTYPDGENLTYHYDSGGLVDGATGVKGANTYPYLTGLQYDKFGQRTLLTTGNGTRTSYTYDAEDRRLAALQASLATGEQFQNTTYTYDASGNVTSMANSTATPTTQSFAYDPLNRLTASTGQYGTANSYALTMSYDRIGNITAKSQQQSSPAVQTVALAVAGNAYAYQGAQPHAPTTIGTAKYKYDANGNLTTVTNGSDKRQLVWDEENRLACVDDKSQHVDSAEPHCDDADVRFVYDAAGRRVAKAAGRDVSLYPSESYSTKNSIAFKHVFVGNTRLVSKMVEPERYEEANQFYYHGDHLGSTGYGTDADGKITEHLQYYPSGETWVREGDGAPTPYQFTGKEYDEETGLYYYGARYYDPKTSVWQSPDPALTSYLDGEANGGVGNPANLAAYSYSYNNPVRLTDPDGRTPEGSPSLLGSMWNSIPWARITGLGAVVSGTGGMLTAAAGCVSTCWTGIGAVGSLGMGLLSYDVAATGARQLWTGEWQHTTTATVLQGFGVPAERTEIVQGILTGSPAGAGTRAGMTAGRIPPSTPGPRAYGPGVIEPIASYAGSVIVTSHLQIPKVRGIYFVHMKDRWVYTGQSMTDIRGRAAASTNRSRHSAYRDGYRNQDVLAYEFIDMTDQPAWKLNAYENGFITGQGGTGSTFVINRNQVVKDGGPPSGVNWP